MMHEEGKSRIRDLANKVATEISDRLGPNDKAQPKSQASLGEEQLAQVAAGWHRPPGPCMKT
jgi:hypothetical protein